MRRSILLLLAAALVTPASSQTFPSARGSWSRAANELSASRLDGQATLLLDGRVAVSGGASAVIDLFDPPTSTFSPGPSDLKARRKFTATRLLDGRVLFAGGESFDRGCSIYDPAGGTVVATALLNTGRQHHTATLLANGKVLVTGGNTLPVSTAPRTTSCEIYDPATGVWSQAGDLAFARADHTATLLPNGKVLIAGGESERWGHVELYDPVTTTSENHRAFSGTRFEASTLADGRIALLDATDMFIGVAIYDPAAGTMSGPWGVVGMPSAPATGVLGDGRVIITGTRTILFDASSHDSAVIAEAIVPRGFPEGVMLNDGRFLVVGGSTSRVAELFDATARGPVRGDFDRDGRSDIVWHHPASRRTILWHMEGVQASGSSLPTYPAAPGHDWRLESIVDIEGGAVMDGFWRDVAPGTYDMQWKPGPDIQPEAPGNYSLLSPQSLDWSVAACADFDADGREEPLWRRTNGEVELWILSTHYPIIRSTPFQTFVGDPNFVIAAADDFDGDGRADVLWRHLVRGENYIWFMDGTVHDYDSHVVGRAGHTASVTDMNYSIAGTGDFDGDGKADIVWRSVFGPTRIWFMNGVTITNDVAVPAPGAGWSVAVIGDFDGDGKSDVFWRNPTTGENAVTLFDSWNVKAASSLPSVTEAGWITPNP